MQYKPVEKKMNEISKIENSFNCKVKFWSPFDDCNRIEILFKFDEKSDWNPPSDKSLCERI